MVVKDFMSVIKVMFNRILIKGAFTQGKPYTLDRMNGSPKG